jgi:hypothetical protein
MDMDVATRAAVIDGVIAQVGAVREAEPVEPERCGLGEGTDHLFGPGEIPDSAYVFWGEAPLTRREKRAVEAVRDRWVRAADGRPLEAQRPEASIERAAASGDPLGITGASLASEAPWGQGGRLVGEGPPCLWPQAFLAEVERELKEGPPRRKGELRVHDLGGSVPEDKHGALRDGLRRLFGDYQRAGPVMHYPESERFCDGVMIGFCQDRARLEKMYKGRIGVSISGNPLDGLAWPEFIGLWELLVSLGIKWTRIDVAFDDYWGLVDVERFKASAKAGEIVHFRSFDAHDGWKTSAGKCVPDNQGLTMGNRGKKGCGKFARVYNKELESKGLVTSTRIEVEFTKRWAEAAGLALSMCSDEDSFASTLGRLVTTAVDVREVEGDGHLQRREYVPWWKPVVDLLGTCPLRAAKKIKSVIRTINTAIVQYGAVFRSFVSRVGPDLFLSLFAEGRGSPRFEKMMDDAPDEVRELVYGAAGPDPGGGAVAASFSGGT